MQACKSCLLSLFGQKREAEVHGIVTWLKTAYAEYQHRVINQKVTHEVFIEEIKDWMSCPVSVFLDDTDSVEEYQTRWMTCCKVQHILDCKDLVEKYFKAEQFTDSDAVQMVDFYNRGFLITAKQPKHIPLLDLPMDVIKKIVDVFNFHKITTPEITNEDFLSIFSTGTASRPYTSCGNLDLALFAYCLRKYKLLAAGWAKTLCSHKMLLTAVGRPMNGKNIGNPSYQFKDALRSHMLSDKQATIKTDLIKVIEDHLNISGEQKAL